MKILTDPRDRNKTSRLVIGVWAILGIAVFVLVLFIPIKHRVIAIFKTRLTNRDKWQQPEKVLSDLSIKPGMTIADIGSGEGYFSIKLAKAAGVEGKIFAVDINQKPLEALQKAANQFHLNNIMTIVSEQTNTRLPSESVDIAFMCDVIHGVPELERQPLLKDIARVLKPEGLFYLIDYKKSSDVPFDPYERLIPHENLVNICREAGFVLDTEFFYLKYQVFFRFKKAKT